MSTPEQRLYQRVDRELRKLKAAGHEVWWMKMHGSPQQKRGVPDLCIVWYGRSVWFELKARGGVPTPLQVHRLEEIRAAGGMGMVIWSAAEAVDILLGLLKG